MSTMNNFRRRDLGKRSLGALLLSALIVASVGVLFRHAPQTALAGPSTQPICTPQNLVVNGDFEQSAQGWTLSDDAQYNTAEVHNGSQSVLLGLQPPVTDAYLYSSAWQQVTIPADAATATLTFWYKPYTESYIWLNRPALSPEQALRVVGGGMPAPDMPPRVRCAGLSVRHADDVGARRLEHDHVRDGALPEPEHADMDLQEL